MSGSNRCWQIFWAGMDSDHRIGYYCTAIMETEPQPPNELTIENVANSIAEQRDADVLFFSGGIAYPIARKMMEACEFRRCRRNLLLIMLTWGGDPDAAYKMSHYLQHRYGNFTFLTSGLCKSAGTLVALGAQEVVITSFGEFGPLDTQLWKRDEVSESQSGLIVDTALTSLQDKAYNCFERFLSRFKGGVGRNATLRTASEIAAELTTGLFSGIYNQIDPLHVGETGRSMRVAREYGLRLQAKSRNYSEAALKSLIHDYPSHDFVIDRIEAEKLFRNVRDPSMEEQLLVTLLGDVACYPPTGRNQEDGPRFLSDELPLAPQTGEPDLAEQAVEKEVGHDERHEAPTTETTTLGEHAISGNGR